jgi:hypothetical protein
VTQDPLSEPRFPVLTSFLTCAFRPATAALRTLYVSLPTAAAIHVLSVLLATVALVILVGWAEGEPLLTSIVSTNAFVADVFADDPKTTILIVVGVALLIEAGFVWLAFWMMPWGAIDEPLRASFSHALRRAWCQSPHALLIILLIGGLTAQLDRLNDAWTTVHPVEYPPSPATLANVMPNTPAWTTHFDEVRRIEREARAAKPWYLRYLDAIVVDFGFLCGVWFLGAMLRAIGVARKGPTILRQPRCDSCGYDLTLMPMDSRCPECGEPVAASLGPDSRPGTPWQRTGNGLLSVWWQTFRTAVRQPTVFGRTLQLQSPGTAHRRFLLLPMPIIFLIGAACLPTLYFIIEGRSPFPEDAHLVLIGSPVFGTLCMVGALMLSLGTASRRGILHAIRDKRNLLSGAVQVVSYLVPFLVLWQIFGAATGIMAIVLSKAPGFQAMCALTWLPAEMWAFFIWSLPNLIWGIVYWRLARMAIAATRYANR